RGPELDLPGGRIDGQVRRASSRDAARDGRLEPQQREAPGAKAQADARIPGKRGAQRVGHAARGAVEDAHAPEATEGELARPRGRRVAVGDQDERRAVAGDEVA